MYNKIKTPTLPVRLFLISIFFFSGFGKTFSQWVSNPETNTKLVSGLVNPCNISAVEDLKGGSFIFWEDNKSGSHKDISFLHIDNNGKPDFRTDGKNVSLNRSDKELPIALTNVTGYVVVAWRDLANPKKRIIKAQKLSTIGSIEWSKDVQITPSDVDVIDFAASSDRKGNAFISYISKSASGQLQLFVQKMSAYGHKYFDKNPVLLNESSNNKLNCAVVADQIGGAFVLWLESIKARSVLLVQHVDSLGKLNWGAAPLAFSAPNGNIVNFNAKSTNNSNLYVAWQVQSNEKKIYHQLITSNGKNIWVSSGKAISSLKGNQTNPQVLTTDSSLTVSWTYEGSGNKDIFIQNFSYKGFPLGKSDGIPVVELKGDQFGQKLLDDKKGGVIVCWIDKRIQNIKANIYAQRINNGQPVWRQNGIPLAISNNTEKSYLNIIPDSKGGALAFFKEKRKEGNNIYGQKVFNTGTYTSQITNFDLQISGDSVKVSWQVNGSAENSVFDIDKSLKQDTKSSAWQIAATIKGKSNENVYSYFDVPANSGAIYYRITQKDKENNIVTSDVKSINYFKGAGNIVVGQNVPNPCKTKTKITFYLPQSARVKIEFFNSQVQKVFDINDTFKSGKNEVTFDGTGLPDGIYFYRFQSGSFTDVKKLLISK